MLQSSLHYIMTSSCQRQALQWKNQTPHTKTSYIKACIHQHANASVHTKIGCMDAVYSTVDQWKCICLLFIRFDDVEIVSKTKKINFY